MSNEPKKTTLAKTTLGWSIKPANPWAPEQQPYTQLLEHQPHNAHVQPRAARGSQPDPMEYMKTQEVHLESPTVRYAGQHVEEFMRQQSAPGYQPQYDGVQQQYGSVDARHFVGPEVQQGEVSVDQTYAQQYAQQAHGQVDHVDHAQAYAQQAYAQQQNHYVQQYQHSDPYTQQAPAPATHQAYGQQAYGQQAYEQQAYAQQAYGQQTYAQSTPNATNNQTVGQPEYAQNAQTYAQQTSGTDHAYAQHYAQQQAYAQQFVQQGYVDPGYAQPFVNGPAQTQQAHSAQAQFAQSAHAQVAQSTQAQPQHAQPQYAQPQYVQSQYTQQPQTQQELDAYMRANYAYAQQADHQAQQQPQSAQPQVPAAGNYLGGMATKLQKRAEKHKAKLDAALRSDAKDNKKERLIANADATVGSSARRRFIKKTYFHLFGAILAFSGLLWTFMNVGVCRSMLAPFVNFALGGRWNWGIVLAGYMGASFIADQWASHSKSRFMQYAGLVFYIVAEAIIFVPLLAVVEIKTYDLVMSGGGDPNIVRDAAFMTLGTFGMLTLSVLISKKDFSFLRSGLFAASGAALMLIVLSLTFGFNLGLVFSIGMVVLAAGYILYQTSQVLAHYDPESHVAASLALFSSVALMFWYMIRILMRARN